VLTDGYVQEALLLSVVHFSAIALYEQRLES